MYRTGKLVLARKQHIKYFQRFLQILPARFSSYDSTRLLIAFYAISGLDILNALDVLSEEKKHQIIEWIYGLQVLPDDKDSPELWKRCGFQGSSTIIFPRNKTDCSTEYAYGHLAMTYTGLATLVILGDDLSRVNRAAIIEGVKVLQQEDGSFCSSLAGSESDMRFVYCAACVCYILRDWSGMDVDKALNFIKRSMLNGLKRWGLSRQISGFQGRPNKPVDTCYSFWLGAVLKILGVFDMVDFEENRNYILSTQDPIVGGLSKWIDTSPDPLHTYMGLCGLGLMEADGLSEVHPALSISQRAHQHLETIHNMWEKK
ncbi:Geranylgeranyl transferase type-1 subunit beta [Blattella germanica]|nr:Geranylgeranyl transferase type-1 subunit beta [Blattella germanica]